MAIEGVIDLSHFQNFEIDFAVLKAQGLLGVIHKATDGMTFVDPLYKRRRREVQDAGLLWGACHFGRIAPPDGSGDGAAQARHFLKTVGDARGVLLALDYEEATGAAPTIMSLGDARLFVTTVTQKVGRPPFFYCDCNFPDCVGARSDPVLGRCKLWLAGYRHERALRMQASWPHWTLWQYTDGAVLPAFGLRCDHDRFAGTATELSHLWCA